MSGRSPVDFYREAVLPALFQRLDVCFPEFGWQRAAGGGWVATDREYTKQQFDARPDRVVCKQPWGYLVHGGTHTEWLEHVTGIAKPGGRHFVEAVRRLAELAGVDTSELDGPRTPEQEARDEARHRREGLLETFLTLAHAELLAGGDDRPLGYLVDGRGFTLDQVRQSSLGAFSRDVRSRLSEAGFSEEELRASGLLADPRWEGRLVIPWRDRWGRIGTFAARDVSGTAEDGAKYLYLSGASKREMIAFGLDVALSSPAGRSHLVLVEGLLDVVRLQLLGFPNIAALGGGGSLLTAERWEALAGMTRAVTLALDYDPKPDGSFPGREGTLAAVENAGKAKAAPEIGILDPFDLAEAAGNPCDHAGRPAKVDPDELVQSRGLHSFVDLVTQKRQTGAFFRGRALLEGLSPDSPGPDRQTAVHRILEFAARLRGLSNGMDRADLLRLLRDRTGYTDAILAEVAEDHERQKRDRETAAAIETATRHAQDAIRSGRPVSQVLSDLEARVLPLRSPATDVPPAFSVDRLDAVTRASTAGRSFGWATLDAIELRVEPGELILTAARTSHGKTTFLVALLHNLLKLPSEGQLVLYSAEEPDERIYHRLLAVLTAEFGAGWTSTEVRDFTRSEYSRGPDYRWPDADRLAAAKHWLREREDRLMVVYRPQWTVEQIDAHVDGLAAARPIDAVFVDYLQKIPVASRLDRRDMEVTAVARQLKQLAVRISVPVVAAAQINREAVKDKPLPEGGFHEDKVQKALRSRRPQLHHLREGGEQEADMVLGLYNPLADYQEDADPLGRMDGVDRDRPARLEVGTLKRRYGETGRWTNLAMLGRFGLIQDPEPEGMF